MSSTPTSTPNRKGGEKGFFNKIRFRRANSESSSSKSKNNSNKKITTTPKAKLTPTKTKKMKTKKKSKDAVVANNGRMVPDDEPILLTRRVIKATRPPSPTTAAQSMVASSSDQGTVDTSLSSSAEDRERPQLLVGKDENYLREKTDKFRMDRLENAAAIRKENKEKEVMQHRLGVAKSGATSDEDDGNAAAAVAAEMEVSDIFKTQTFHPEHKRKVSSDDHLETEKKTKLDDGVNNETAVVAEEEVKTSTEDEIEDDKQKAVVQKRWQSALSGWITAVAPATVLAACTFMMMRVMRKR